jgi:serine protease Do
LYEPITATICEAWNSAEPKLPIAPEGSDSLDLFSFHDPFGLRKAVVPVLMNDIDGVTNGMGTAFHIDGWGMFVTADHVIESVRKRSSRVIATTGEIGFKIEDPDLCPILLLGLGLVFGKPAVPTSALARVAQIRSAIQEREDPLAALRGQSEFEAAADVALMQVGQPIPNEMIGTLAMRLSGIWPAVGETVVAVGFPELDCKPIDDDATRYLLSDGMSAAYGRIIGVHPKGVRNFSTPVIEVEANWPPGMSGGPVFNSSGQVIGVVSRSWLPSGGKYGIGYAACFSMMPWVRRWIPTLDAANPCWRVGWAIMNNGEDLIAFYKDKKDALAHQTLLGASFSVVSGSNRIGSDDFMPSMH